MCFVSTGQLLLGATGLATRDRYTFCCLCTSIMPFLVCCALFTVFVQEELVTNKHNQQMYQNQGHHIYVWSWILDQNSLQQ
jgi:hypothetical protein